jgi:hypothetical protein
MPRRYLKPIAIGEYRIQPGGAVYRCEPKTGQMRRVEDPETVAMVVQRAHQLQEAELQRAQRPENAE